MLIKVDDKDYNLLTTEKREIRILNLHEDVPTVYAHAQNSLDEVAAYIRQFQQSSAFQVVPESMLEFFRIDLFGKKYPVKIIRNEDFQPYIKADLVYCSAKANTDIQQTKFAENLREQLFQQYVLQRVSHWEEQLNVLANDIHFRMLKASPYKTNVDNANITFNKQIKDLSLRTIDYFVFSAILPLLPEENELALINQYFPDTERLLNQFR